MSPDFQLADNSVKAYLNLLKFIYIGPTESLQHFAAVIQLCTDKSNCYHYSSVSNDKVTYSVKKFDMIVTHCNVTAIHVICTN